MDKAWKYCLHSSIYMLSVLSIFSCKDDEVKNNLSPSVVSFKTPKTFSSEGSGIQEVTLMLDHSQESETRINFILEGSALEENDSPHGFSDYQLLTPSPVIIKEGETAAQIRFLIKEDALFETEEEFFTLEIHDVSEGNARLDENQDHIRFTHFIRENDFQIDLLWKPEASYDAWNIDFYLEGSDNMLLSSQAHDLGKTILLTNAQENGNYYLEIGYEAQNEPKAYSLSIQRGGLPDITLFDIPGKTDNGNNSKNLDKNYMLQNFRLIKSGMEFILSK